MKYSLTAGNLQKMIICPLGSIGEGFVLHTSQFREFGTVSLETRCMVIFDLSLFRSGDW